MNPSLSRPTLAFAFLAAFAVSAAACSDPETTGGAGGQGSSNSSSGAGGSSFSGGAGGAGGADAFDFCAEVAARDASCGSDNAAMCDDQKECAAGLMAPVDADEWLRCLAQRPCDTGDDSCIGAIQAKHQDDAAKKSFLEACNTKRTDCAADSFSDDHCYTVFVLEDALVSQYSGCLEKPCGEVVGCFDALAPAACAAL